MQLDFLKSVEKFPQLPNDIGNEVAIIGSSNVGKSTLINVIANQRKLARTGKKPGVTQLINVFVLKGNLNLRLMDLPGYGYAKVPHEVRDNWHILVNQYLSERKSLVGLFLLMDARHPFKPFDCELLNWAKMTNLPLCTLFTKTDKLNAKEKTILTKRIRTEMVRYGENVENYLVSAAKGFNIDKVILQLEDWLRRDPSFHSG